MIACSHDTNNFGERNSVYDAIHIKQLKKYKNTTLKLTVFNKILLKIFPRIDKGSSSFSSNYKHICFIYSNTGNFCLGLGKFFTL